MVLFNMFVAGFCCSAMLDAIRDNQSVFAILNMLMMIGNLACAYFNYTN